MGRQMRKYLVEEKGLLSPEFNPNEVYVRSTDVNRTIDSALSQVQGLFHYPHALSPHQQDILPPFKLSHDVLNLAQNLGSAPLPNNIAAVPVHIPNHHFDEFNPMSMCKALSAAHHHHGHGDYVYKTLTDRYWDHIQEYGDHFNFKPDQYTARHELDSSDTVWSHWFDRRETPGLSDEFLKTMMDMRRDYFHHNNCAEPWMAKVYTTHTLATILNEFYESVNWNKNGMADDANRRKFYFWSDHDTGVQNFSCVFNYKFPIYIPFDAHILFELYYDSDYYVTMKIDDKPFVLGGACGDKIECPLNDFKQHVQEISYVGDMEKWKHHCKHGSKEYA